MHVCKNCGKENREDYRFCLGCGMEIGPDEGDGSTPNSTSVDVAPRRNADTERARRGAAAAGPAPEVAASDEDAGGEVICPHCGASVPNFAFCGQCGGRLGAAAAAAPAKARTMYFGGQAPQAAPKPRGKLVLIRPDGSEGGSHPLTDGANRIGRTSGPIFEADNYLSPRHADLTLTAAGVLVQDADSLNGVFVKLTDEEEIRDREVFRIGQELLRFDVIRVPSPLDDGTEVMGSPNPGYWGRVALIIGKDQDGSAFPLFGDSIILGRERGDILFPEDGYVSGTHARLSIRDDRFFLADMNSSNGTFLRIRGERTVRSGTFLLMGQQLFKVLYS